MSTELHLLEYHKQKLAYLKGFQARSQQVSVKKVALRTFAKPESSGKNLAGYDGTSITDDLITDVFARFSEQTRQKESEESMRTKSGRLCSLCRVRLRARDKVHRHLPFLVTHADGSRFCSHCSRHHLSRRDFSDCFKGNSCRHRPGPYKTLQRRPAYGHQRAQSHTRVCKSALACRLAALEPLFTCFTSRGISAILPDTTQCRNRRDAHRAEAQVCPAWRRRSRDGHSRQLLSRQECNPTRFPRHIGPSRCLAFHDEVCVIYFCTFPECSPFRVRYMICVLGGMKNPVRKEVARSIVDAILKSTASDNAPARYWSKEEQERRLEEAYNKWATRGGVWSVAAEKVRRLVFTMSTFA